MKIKLTANDNCSKRLFNKRKYGPISRRKSRILLIFSNTQIILEKLIWKNHARITEWPSCMTLASIYLIFWKIKNSGGLKTASENLRTTLTEPLIFSPFFKHWTKCQCTIWRNIVQKNLFFRRNCWKFT